MSTDWEASYLSPTSPVWDVGVQPAMLEVPLVGGVLDVGCGRGAHTFLAVARGHYATGIDISPAAIDQARERADELGIVHAEFFVADVCALHPEAAFDTVLDVGCFHCLPVEQRPDYVASLTGVTRPGARLHLLCFADVPEHTMGMGVSPADLEATFRDQAWTAETLTATTTHLRYGIAPAAAWLATFVRT